MTTTTQQDHVIAQQAAFYDTNECPCAGLLSYRAYDPAEWGDPPKDWPEGSIAVDFTYIYEDNPDAFGLETTIFAPDGTVLDSQDFG